MRAMTKKLLSALVVLAMVLSMVPVVGLPAIEAKAAVNTSAAWDATENPYCPICGEDAGAQTWTAVDGTTVKRIGFIGTTGTHHYYIQDDFACNESGWFINANATGENVHLNMNGKKVTVGTATTGGIIAQSGGSVAIFNTAAELGEFTSRDNSSYGVASVSNGTFTLGSNVKLYSTSANAKPVVTVSAGTFTMEAGSEISASGTGVFAVSVARKNTEGTCAFVMNGGTVTGGSGNKAILNGQLTGTVKTGFGTVDLNGGTINGGITAYSNTLTLNGNVSATGTIAVYPYGKLVVDKDWTGTATAQFVDVTITADKVPAANAAASAAFEGVLTEKESGRQLVWDDASGLKLAAAEAGGEDPEVGVFNPEDCGGMAYCPVCGDTEAQSWTAVDDCTDKRIGIVGEGIHHYYIRDNLTCGKTGWFASAAGEGKIIHLNMNGKKVSVGENATTGGINLSGGEMEIFNTSTTVGELEVVKNSNSSYPGMVYIADGEFVLGDKVKLTGKEINGSVPFMYVLSGTFRMDGGEVSAEFMESEAVWVKKTTNKASAFIMNGGTVTGGTGDAVHVGTSTDTGTVSFEMTGGTINGTVYVTEYCTNAPVLSGKPTLTVKLDNATETARLNVAGLTGGNITLTEVAVGAPFATNATEAMKDYFNHANSVLFENNCLYVGAAKVDGVWYATTAAAVTNAGGKVVVMGGDAKVGIPADTTAKVDAAGHNITVTGEGTLYAIDSANNTYDATKCGTWTISNVTKWEAEANGGKYVLIAEEAAGTYTAHRVDIYISAVNLRTINAGLYYTAEYKCDDVLKGKIKTYGVALSLSEIPTSLDNSAYTAIETATKPLTAAGTNTYTTNSGAVVNILTEGNAENAANAIKAVKANAYLDIETGAEEPLVVMGIADEDNGASYSLADVLDTINTGWNEPWMIETAKTLVAQFYKKWSAVFEAVNGYDFTNIANKANSL